MSKFKLSKQKIKNPESYVNIFFPGRSVYTFRISGVNVSMFAWSAVGHGFET